MKRKPRREPFQSLDGIPESEWLTVDDVASILKISYGTARDLAITEKLEFVRIGRCIRIEVRALRAFIAASRRPLAPPFHMRKKA